MGSVITFRHKGDLKKTRKFLEHAAKINFESIMAKYGSEGVKALEDATPKDTGYTAGSWTYKVENNGDVIRLSWYNTHENQGVNIAVILQYGHGTRNGGWVEGRDFINPAVKPVFDKIAEEAWKEVTRG